MENETFGLLAARLSLQDELLWFAFLERNPVGFATLNTKLGYFSRVGVLHQYRGNGLLGKFIRTIDTRGIRLHLSSIITDTVSLSVANAFIDAGYRLYRPDEPYGLKKSLYLKKTFE